MSSGGKAAVRPLERPRDTPGDEAIGGTWGAAAPVEETNLLERRLEAQQLRRARPQVRRHQGAPGVDGRTVADLGASLKPPWPRMPSRRAAIPTPGGGTRTLGMPTGRDRCSAHALLQVLQEDWDPTCSARRDGVRPPRRAPQAVGPAQASTRAGDTWVVDRDREHVFRPGDPRRVAEPSAPTGDGPTGGPCDPPVPDRWRIDPGGERRADGGRDAARGTAVAPPSQPAAGRARSGAGAARTAVRPRG